MILGVLLPLAVIVILVAVNGLFVAAEFALVGSRQSKIQKRADEGSRSAKWLLAIFKKRTGKDSYVAVAQLGITLASIGLGMYGEPAVAKWLYGPLERVGLDREFSRSVAFVIALSAITYLHVVLGEMIPKALALQAPEKVALSINPAMRAFSFIFRPAVKLLNATAFYLMRLLRIPEPDKKTQLYTSAELAIVTDESADSGQLGEMQRGIIKNLHELDRRPVAEIMTPRTRLTYLKEAESVEAITEKISGSEFTRYPVVGEDLDDVIGVLHVKDFIRVHQSGSANWGEVVRPLACVTESTTIANMFLKFKMDQVHASLVIDEFGSTLGFVTMDDIITGVMEKEITEEIEDAVVNPDGSFFVDGEMTVHDLDDTYHIAVSRPHVVTAAGLVLFELGAIPEVGQSVHVDDWEFVVVEMQKRKIVRLLVRPPENS